MSESERIDTRAKSLFPKVWSIHVFRSIIVSGYVAGICSTFLLIILPIFFLPFSNNGESLGYYFMLAKAILVLSPIIALIGLPPFIFLAISWLLYFKLKGEKNFYPNHAWGLVGGWSMMTIPLIAIHWLLFFPSTIENSQGLGVVLITFWIAQLPKILLGTMIGLVVGNFCKRNPTKYHILSILTGVVILGVIGAILAPDFTIFGIFHLFIR